jgi:hypothetical protein
MRYATRLSLPLALAAVACTPAAASATLDPPSSDPKAIRIFKVTADGYGTYSRGQTIPNAGGLPSNEIHESVNFAWHTTLPAVGFYSNGEAFLLGPSPETGFVDGVTKTSGTADSTFYGFDNDTVVATHGACEAKAQTDKILFARVKTDQVTSDPNAAGANLKVTPFFGLGASANCTQDIYFGHADLKVNVPEAALEQRFFLPREATRENGKVIQLVKAEPDQVNQCTKVDFMTSCELNWSGTLTFEYVGNLAGGDPTPSEIPTPLPPVPPDDDIEIPNPPPPPADDDDIEIPNPKPKGAKFSPSGGTASLNVTCGAACSGTVSAYIASGARGAAAKPLATAAFKAPAGKAAKVKLRFRGAALRKVRKAKALRLVVKTKKGATKAIVVRAR